MMGIYIKTRKLLWGRSGSRCAICKTMLIEKASGRIGDVVIGEECHIISSKEKGPRYKNFNNSNYVDSYKNLILLCANHHKLIDHTPEIYTVKKLLHIRKEHESWVNSNLGLPKKGKYVYLPYRSNQYFTGREEILTRMYKELQKETTSEINTNIVALVGLGGIGKTQVVIEYINRHNSEYEGVFWVTCDILSSIHSDFLGIAQVIGLDVNKMQNQDRIVASVLSWLGEKNNWLLVFDNLDNPDLMLNNIPRNPKGHIIITSRTPFLDKVGVQKPIEILKLNRNEAVEFLLKRTGRTNVSADETSSVNKLARELGYLPLALEQAGAYIFRVKCGFGDYLWTYKKLGVRFLEKVKPITGRYNKSVLLTWLLNFKEVRRVSMASSDVLKIISFLNAENIPMELFSMGYIYLGSNIYKHYYQNRRSKTATDQMLYPLSQYSLIRKAYSAGTLEVHRLVQAVIRSQMSLSAQCEWIRKLSNAFNYLFPRQEPENWKISEPLIRHVKAISDYIYKYDRRYRAAVRLFIRCGIYLRDRGRYNEAIYFLKLAERTSINKNNGVTGLRVKTINELGITYSVMLNYKKAESCYNNIMSLFCSNTNKLLVAEVNNNLGVLYCKTGRYHESLKCLETSLKLRKEILPGNAPEIAETCNNLGVTLWVLNRVREAGQFYRRAYNIWKNIYGMNHPRTAFCISNMGLVQWRIGNILAAKKHHEQALKIRRTIYSGQNHPEIAQSLNNMGAVWNSLGKYNKAIEMHKDALRMRVDMFGYDNLEVARSQYHLAKNYSDIGDVYRANAFIRNSLKTRKAHLPDGNIDKKEAMDLYKDISKKLGKKKREYH